MSSPSPSPSPLTTIFIVPFRDRHIHKQMFLNKMTELLSDWPSNSYEIYFAHQCDARPFNRGAMKNIGFLAMKQKYQALYSSLTFIFHDVDTWPKEKGMVPYTTSPGVVSHYYGFNFALGGMFAIKGADFEKTRGFPNFWGWGLEDNLMNDRCLATGLHIDRSVFYDIHDRERIERPFDGFNRLISKADASTYKYDSPDTFLELRDVKWTISNEFINITSFLCRMGLDDQDFRLMDIRKEQRIPIVGGYRGGRNWSMKKLMNKR